MAVKLLGSLAHNSALADRLRKEVAVYSYMKPCAHIVEFIGVCEEKNSFNIVMEWATWGDLHTFMLENEKWGQITEQEKLRMAVEAAQGLEFLHAVSLYFCCVYDCVRSPLVANVVYKFISYSPKCSIKTSEATTSSSPGTLELNTKSKLQILAAVVNLINIRNGFPPKPSSGCAGRPRRG